MGGSLKDVGVAVALSGAVVPFPTGGARRVHPRPTDVYRPRPTSEGSTQQPGPNRFDDPQHHYPVRYLAEVLYVCLLEVLARLRPSAPADGVLNEMSPGLDDPALADLVDPEQAAALEDFLARNKVAVFGAPSGAVLRKLVDVFDPAVLAALDDHHWIRDHLGRPETVAAYGDDEGAVHLDGSLIRNASRKVGRPVTQQISRLLIDILGMRGLRYYSRHAEGVEAICWAVHGDVTLPVRSVEPLDSNNDVHRAAVQLVATRYRLPLPMAWASSLTS